MGFLGILIRVTVGFVLACLAAGAVKVLFAVTPSELIDASTQYWQQSGIWTLYSSTMIAMFAAPFAIISAIFSEWQGIRSFAYHGFIGIAIAVAGFALIATGESPDAPSIVNSYAMAAFLTTGLVSGFVYWLFSGRFAYRGMVVDAANTLVGKNPVDKRQTISQPTATSADAALPAQPVKPAPSTDRQPAGDAAQDADKKPAAQPALNADRRPSTGTVPATGPKPPRAIDA